MRLLNAALCLMGIHDFDLHGETYACRYCPETRTRTGAEHLLPLRRETRNEAAGAVDRHLLGGHLCVVQDREHHRHERNRLQTVEPQMSNVIDITADPLARVTDAVDKATLQKMARAIAGRDLPVKEAEEFLAIAYRMGMTTGKRDAYRAANKMVLGQAGE